MDKHFYVVLMAGGEGNRFYPLSTPEQPKQFLNFIGEDTFIRQTYNRALKIVSSENIYMSTNEKYVDLVKKQILDIPDVNIIGEPVKKNTAPALAYATAMILNRDKNAIICCLPSDHHIEDESGFIGTILKAKTVAANDYLVTLGMKPSWPSPEYGYISPSKTGTGWSKVDRFVEKPNSEMACEYVDKGYFWNGGIFIWKADGMMAELKLHAPRVYSNLDSYCDGYEFRRSYFSSAEAKSIDYALMERSSNVAVIPTSVGWSDVGTWDSVRRLIDAGVDMSSCVKSVMFGDDRTPWRCIVSKPWGHEEIWAKTDKYVGKMLFIKKGERLSMQYHKVKDETLRLMSGELKLQLDGGIKKMKPGDVYHIPPNTKHRMIAVTNSLVLEVSTTELDDVVILSDDYGRVVE